MIEPRREKTGFLQMRKQPVTAKLISAFVFATRIVQSLYFLHPKFRASSHFLWLHSPVCVKPDRFSHVESQFILTHFLTDGFSHPYHLDEHAFISRVIGSDFSTLFHFSMKFVSANRIAPDGTPRFAASHLGLFCLSMSHKKDPPA